MTNMAKQPTEIRAVFAILKEEAGSLSGTEIRVLVRARLVSSPRVRFTQYVPDPLKARLTVSRHISSTSTGLQTAFWSDLAGGVGNDGTDLRGNAPLAGHNKVY